MSLLRTVGESNAVTGGLTQTRGTLLAPRHATITDNATPTLGRYLESDPIRLGADAIPTPMPGRTRSDSPTRSA